MKRHKASGTTLPWSGLNTTVGKMPFRTAQEQDCNLAFASMIQRAAMRGMATSMLLCGVCLYTATQSCMNLPCMHQHARPPVAECVPCMLTWGTTPQAHAASSSVCQAYMEHPCWCTCIMCLYSARTSRGPWRGELGPSRCAWHRSNACDVTSEHTHEQFSEHQLAGQHHTSLGSTYKVIEGFLVVRWDVYCIATLLHSGQLVTMQQLQGARGRMAAGAQGCAVLAHNACVASSARVAPNHVSVCWFNCPRAAHRAKSQPAVLPGRACAPSTVCRSINIKPEGINPAAGATSLSARVRTERDRACVYGQACCRAPLKRRSRQILLNCLYGRLRVRCICRVQQGSVRTQLRHQAATHSTWYAALHWPSCVYMLEL